MNEIRCDPLTGYRVLFAEGRSARPHDYKTSHQVHAGKSCPFCAGNESETPDEIFRIPSPEDEDCWQTRIVCNKYPALVPPASPDTVASLPSEMYLPLADASPSVTAEGLHEVIIESPDHCVRTTDLPIDHLAVVLQTTQTRIEQICQMPTLQSVHVFKNVGPAGGATIEHAHSQLIALPMVPPTLAGEQTVIVDYHQRTGSCLLCDLQSRECTDSRRVVAENASFIAFCAYAGRQPGETWIVPKQHQADFTAGNENEHRLLADLLHLVLSRIDTVFNLPSYNYMIHTAPLEGDSRDHYHWRLVIVPRMTIRAGFEWSTGCFINPVAPERAAEAMRRQVPIHEIPVHPQTTSGITLE